MNLAQQLGYDANDRLLLINGDDYGVCHSVNQSVQHLLAAGAISSATIMMPCGWAPEGASWSAQNPQYDVGVHLTFTSEWDRYKWGPVTMQEAVHSLVTEEGYFPKDCKTFEQQADESQVRAEIISQIEKALKFGMNPTHADNHMGSLYGLTTGRNFLPLVLSICADYGLPFRLPRYLLQEDGQVAPPELAEQAKQLAALADSYGVVILDYLVGLPFHLAEGETYDVLKNNMKQLLHSLRPGVSELIIHPSYVTDELKAFHFQPEKRGMEHQLFLDPEMTSFIKEEGIKLIRWRELQQLQRSRKQK